MEELNDKKLSKLTQPLLVADLDVNLVHTIIDNIVPT